MFSFRERSRISKKGNEITGLRDLEEDRTIQRDGTGREEGRGFRMGNTCIPVADSC